MNKSIIIFFFCLISFAQEKVIDFDSPDSLYREDQFYVGISYSNIQNAPQGFDQIKISSNVVFGFLRDFPLNKKRTWAIAPGLGFRISNINHNLLITENNSTTNYSILTSEFNKNKLILNYLELPLEIRWRNSTPESHKFWRIYSGVKLSYLIYDINKYEAFDTKIRSKQNSDLNKLQLGAYITAGWNTWNAFLYYGITPIFNEPTINNETLKLNQLNIGLMFYIL